MGKTICQICGRTKISTLAGLDEYFFCSFCKTAWRKSTRLPKYRKSYYKGRSGLISRIFSPIEIFFYFIRRSYLGLDKKDVWIDVGAGEGKFLATVNAKRKIGVEVSSYGRSEIAKAGLEALTDNEFLNLKGQNADVITFWNVLEHTKKPWDFLKSARRNLAKEGRIVIGVPNIDSFEAKFFLDQWFHLAPKYHIWHFSPSSITRLLKKTGFKIEKIDFWSVEHHLTGLIQSFINKTTRSDNFLHNLVKRGVSQNEITLNNVFWSLFWLSFGLPIILFLFVVQATNKKSGTFVVVASPTNK